MIHFLASLLLIAAIPQSKPPIAEIGPPGETPRPFFGTRLAATGNIIAVADPEGIVLYRVTRRSVEMIDQLPFQDKNSPVADFDITSGLKCIVGGAGQATVYEELDGSWITTTISNPMDESGTSFGLSVSLSGDTCAISSPGEDRVFIFEKQMREWRLVDTLAPEGAEAGRWFGSDIVLSGRYCAVSTAGGYSHVGPDPTVFIFENRDGDWQLDGTVGADNIMKGAAVTDSPPISLDGEWLLVSGHREAVTGLGAAIFYSKKAEGWTEFSTCHGSGTGREARHFGSAASIRVPYAAVATAPVAVHLFQLEDGEWQHVTTVRGTDVRPVPGVFADQISVGDGFVVIGHPAAAVSSSGRILVVFLPN